MTIDTINKRIENAQKKLDKLNKKMDRIKKAEASNWENNPYGYYEGDLKYTQRDIDEATDALNRYQTMLGEENDKAASRNVDVIVDFLNAWRDNARNWYNERRNGKERQDALRALKTATKKCRDLEDNQFKLIGEVEKKICEEEGWDYNDDKVRYGKDLYHHPKVEAERKKIDAKIVKLRQKRSDLRDAYEAEYADIETMEQNANYEVQIAELKKMEAEYKAKKMKWVSWEHHVELTKAQKNKAWKDSLEKLLQKEWNRKYDKLLNDVIAITGTIDDCSALRINEKGDLDGFVYGKKGTARVNTFGAGGYNIQCFHYRTKVTKVR